MQLLKPQNKLVVRLTCKAKVSVSSVKMANTKFKIQMSRTFYTPFLKKPEVPRISFEVTGFFFLDWEEVSYLRFGTWFLECWVMAT